MGFEREEIKERYERKRRERLRKKDKIKEIVPTKQILEELKSKLFQEDLPYKNFEIIQILKWRRPQKRWPKEDHRQKFFHTLYQFSKFKRLEFEIKPFEEFPYNCISLKLDLIPKNLAKIAVVQKILDYSKLFLFEDSVHFVDYLSLKILGSSDKKKEVLAEFYCISNKYGGKKPEKYIEKEKYVEAFTLDDIDLVANYYKSVEKFILSEILNKELTIRYAVKSGEGGIRRKDKYGKRLIIKKFGELSEMVRQYKVIEIIPDLNFFGSNFVDRIVIDFDPGKVISWYRIANFVNHVCNLLKEFNFKYNLRFTGGSGFHIVLKGKFDRVPEWYPLVDKGLKFETLEERYGEFGIISRALADFGRLVGLASAYERKNSLKEGFGITLEKENPAHRYYFIFIDVHSFPNKGVRCLGSLHHKTGNVCLPLKKAPLANDMESLIKNCHIPIEIPKDYKIINLVMENPQILTEPEERNENIVDKINKFVENYKFLAEKYPVSTEERNSFYRSYIW